MRVRTMLYFYFREHEYSRIRSVDDENLYFKVGSDSGSESGYAHVHARETSLKRAGAKAGSDVDARVGTVSTLAREHGVLITGDDMYAEIRKTSNPDRYVICNRSSFPLISLRGNADFIQIE